MLDPFLSAILAAPDDPGPRLVYADSLEERGDPTGPGWRSPVTATPGWCIYSLLSFCGGGIGRGRGRGGGSGIGEPAYPLVTSMIPGSNYLVHCGDWHTFVGHCVRQVGPLIFEFERVSKVSDTNGGDNWHLLAAGDEAARRQASYIHYTTPAYLPLSIGAFLWAGDLPERGA